MVAIAIVAMLAAMAIPTFAKIRQSARQARLIADLRAYVAFFQTYQMRYGEWPGDGAPGEAPPGLVDDLPPGWVLKSSLGGEWQWTTVDSTKAIVLNNPDASANDFARIDSKIDDGSPNAGIFRIQGASWVYLMQ